MSGQYEKLLLGYFSPNLTIRDFNLMKATITFEKDPNHSTSVINGVWGGVIGDGNADLIEINLLTQMNAEIGKVEVDSATGQELGRYPSELKKCQVIKFTAIMSLRATESMANWMMEKVAEARRTHTQANKAEHVGQVQ